MKVVLELLDQPSNVRRINVRHDIVIGRGSECNLRLSSPQVSRRHCFLRIGKDSASITDLDSSNGTFLNGSRISSGQRSRLQDGMVLAVGPIRFVVQVREEAVASEVLGGQLLNDSIRLPVRRADRSGATVVDSGDAVVERDSGRAREPAIRDASVFSLEHAGVAADEHEATADYDADDKSPVPVHLDEVELVEDVEVIEDVELIEDFAETDDPAPDTDWFRSGLDSGKSS